MPHLLSSRLSPLLGMLLLAVCVGCTSPAERRNTIETIDDTWITEVPEDSLTEMTENVRKLGALKAGSPEAFVSLPLLARQAHSSPSALVRADALRAAWRLAKDLPAPPLTATAAKAAEFNDWMQRFEELDLHPDHDQGEEIQELATRIARYRFPPSQARYAVELASVVVVRGFQRRPSPVQEIFALEAPGATRHALTLVSLQAAEDSVTFVREEALRAARYFDVETAVRRLSISLTTETDPVVLFTVLESIQVVGQQSGAEKVARLLEAAEQSPDAAVRRRAAAIAEALAEAVAA